MYLYVVGVVLIYGRVFVYVMADTLSLRDMLRAPTAEQLQRPLEGVPGLLPEDRVLLENVIAVVYAVVDGRAAPAPRSSSVGGVFVDYDGKFADAASAARCHVLVFRVRLDGVGALFTLNRRLMDAIVSVNEMRVADVGLRLYGEDDVGSGTRVCAALVVHVLKANEPIIVETCDIVRVRQRRRVA